MRRRWEAKGDCIWKGESNDLWHATMRGVMMMPDITVHWCRNEIVRGGSKTGPVGDDEAPSAAPGCFHPFNDNNRLQRRSTRMPARMHRIASKLSILKMDRTGGLHLLVHSLFSFYQFFLSLRRRLTFSLLFGPNTTTADPDLIFLDIFSIQLSFYPF